jgi:aminodeoxyfutalosine deaminase
LYRKFTANNIFTGSNLLPAGNVLITDTAGLIKEIIPEKEAGDNVERLIGILTPGFINAHCHMELSHLKGVIPEKTGLVDFVYNIITQRHFAQETILAAIMTAETDMLQNGIIAVGDICNTTHSITQKQQQRLLYHNFIEVAGFVPAGATTRFETATETLHQFLSTAHCQWSSISPHAPYSVSPALFELLNNYPNNNLITIHNQETAAEDELYKTGTGDFLRLYEKLGIDISFFKHSGKSSLQTFLPHFKNNQSLILVHNVTTSKEDIDFVKLRMSNIELPSVFYCLCPNANQYISNIIPNVNRLIENGCNIVLGTDSLASNHQLSILEEMKTLQQHFPQLELQTLLQWATFNGAKALQMEGKLGSFEKGKQPGIVLIENTNDLQLTEKSTSKRIL